MPDAHVTSLLQARDGSLWVGTWNGLCHLSIRQGSDPLLIGTYDRKRGPLPGVVGALLESSDGALWMGTDAGLHELSWSNGRAVIQHISARDGLDQNHIGDLAEDAAGNLWTSGSGLVEVIRGGFRRYGKDDGLDENYVTSILQNTKGEFCVTTRATAASPSSSLNRSKVG